MLFNQWLQFKKSEQKEHNEVEIVEEFLKGQYEASFNTISSHYSAGGYVPTLQRVRCGLGDAHCVFS
eukprot:6196862-Pleurochrysis_carterae.AAC.1